MAKQGRLDRTRRVTVEPAGATSDADRGGKQSVTGKPRSVRQAQALQIAQLRSQGRTWAEIAAAFQVAYRVNPRVALRQAHGWSQPQAAERWTERWPDDPKTFKNFSYWEQWPGPTGHAPSLDTLDRLAQLYECRLTDLLADCRDYGRPARSPVAALRTRDRPVAAGQRPVLTGPVLPRPVLPGPVLPGQRAMPAGVATAAPGRIEVGQVPEISSSALQAALELIRQAGAAHPGAADSADEGPDSRLRRRTLLLEASSALAVVAAAPILEVPRMVAGSRNGRLHADRAIVGYTGEVVAGLRRLGGAVGPRVTLQPAMALRSAMASMARSVPEIVTGDALTAYGDLTQLIGWLMFNLGDLRAAQYYYEDARAAAYRAGNGDLVTYTLAAASQLAAARSRPRHAIDHAQAALQTARGSGSPYAAAYAADVSARAYAATGQVARCQAALDKEQDALALIAADTPRAPWWYFYDRSFYWGTESECALRLDMPVDASDAAYRALHLVGPLNLHNSALTLAFRAEALIKQGEIEEACETLADVARLTTLNSSRRIARRIDVLRAQLAVADDTAAVRDLDDRLTEFRRARAAEPGDYPARSTDD